MNAPTRGGLVSEATRLCEVWVGGHRARLMIGTLCGADLLGIAKSAWLATPSPKYYLRGS